MVFSAIFYTLDDANFFISVFGLAAGIAIASAGVLAKPTSLSYKLQTIALFSGIAFGLAIAAFFIAFWRFFDF
jgi:hypothetical protein